MSAYVILSWDALREFFASNEEFPGGEVYKYQLEKTVGRTFISMDGPEHDIYRRLVTPAFRSRAAIRFVDEELTPLAHELLDGLVKKGEADLVTEFTNRLPFWAISQKLGLPEGYEDRQREWALAIMDRSLSAVQSSFEQAGKGPQFEALKPWLVGDSENLSQSDAAASLGITNGAVKVAIHRLRKAFRSAVETEIAQTLPSSDDVASELAYLIEVLS
jgi:cytochrome P450